MARVLFVLFVALAALLGPPTRVTTPFELRVVDEHTGIGVPVRVTADDRISRDSPNGYIYWWRPSLMSRTVSFAVRDETSQFESVVAAVRVTSGGKATVKLRRRT